MSLSSHTFMVINGKVKLLLCGNTVVNGEYNIVMDKVNNTFYVKINGHKDNKTIHSFDRLITLELEHSNYNDLLVNAQKIIDQEFIDSVDTGNEFDPYILQNVSENTQKFTYTYNDNTSYMVWNTNVEMQTISGYGNSSVPSINPRHIEYGCYRKSESVAFDALMVNKLTNRLHALVEQLDGFCEWKENSSENYTIVKTNKGYITEGNAYKNPCVVYMTLDCANEICNMINYGIFKLEGKI